MKKIVVITILISIIWIGIGIAQKEEGTRVSEPAPYTHLAGIERSYSYFIKNKVSDSATGIFFKNSINNSIGISVSLGSFSIPIKEYTTSSGTNYNGSGEKKYTELSFGITYYLWVWKKINFIFGLNYCDFESGYIKVSSGGNTSYKEIELSKTENLFGAFAGVDLLTPVTDNFYGITGIKFVYYIQQDEAMRGVFTLGFGYSF